MSCIHLHTHIHVHAHTYTQYQLVTEWFARIMVWHQSGMPSLVLFFYLSACLTFSFHHHGSYAYVLLCPLYQDEYMVRSNSLNERIKLWDKFSGIVDQHAVKLNFLKHVHRPHPPFRVKRRLPARKTVTVSVLVASCYLCILFKLVYKVCFLCAYVVSKQR